MKKMRIEQKISAIVFISTIIANVLLLSLTPFFGTYENDSDKIRLCGKICVLNDEHFFNVERENGCAYVFEEKDGGAWIYRISAFKMVNLQYEKYAYVCKGSIIAQSLMLFFYLCSMCVFFAPIIKQKAEKKKLLL